MECSFSFFCEMSVSPLLFVEGSYEGLNFEFDLLGRAVRAPGPAGLRTEVLRDYCGRLGWLDVVHGSWHRYDLPRREYVVQRPGRMPPGLVRDLRANFVVRNFFAILGRPPTLARYNIVRRFVHERVVAGTCPFWDEEVVPNYILECADSRYPYVCERMRAHPSVRRSGSPLHSIPVVCELNAFCEWERYRCLECYLPDVPLDYPIVREMLPPSRDQVYTQRFPVPGSG